MDLETINQLGFYYRIFIKNQFSEKNTLGLLSIIESV